MGKMRYHVLMMFFLLCASIVSCYRTLNVCEKLENDPRYGTRPGEVCQCEGKRRVIRRIDGEGNCIICPDQHRFDQKMKKCTWCADDENCGESVRGTCRRCSEEELEERRRNRNPFPFITPPNLSDLNVETTTTTTAQMETTTESLEKSTTTVTSISGPNTTPLHPTHMLETQSKHPTPSQTTDQPNDQDLSYIIGYIFYVFIGLLFIVIIMHTFACNRNRRPRAVKILNKLTHKDKPKEIGEEEIPMNEQSARLYRIYKN